MMHLYAHDHFQCLLRQKAEQLWCILTSEVAIRSQRICIFTSTSAKPRNLSWPKVRADCLTRICMLQKIKHFAVNQEQLSLPTRSSESLYKLGIIYFGVKVQKTLSVAQLVLIKDYFYSAMRAASLQIREMYFTRK